MCISRNLVISLIAISAFNSSVHAGLSHHQEEKISYLAKKKKYRALGDFVEDKITLNPNRLDQIEELATSIHSDPLLRAAEATEQFQNRARKLGLRTSEFFEIALFLETGLSHF